jgi:hypothetical protein
MNGQERRRGRGQREEERRRRRHFAEQVGDEEATAWTCGVYPVWTGTGEVWAHSRRWFGPLRYRLPASATVGALSVVCTSGLDQMSQHAQHKIWPGQHSTSQRAVLGSPL